MDTLSSSLYKTINESYKKEIASNQEIKKLLKKMKKQSANYQDALEFAENLGNCLKKAFAENVTSEMLPNGKMPFIVAKEIIEPILKENYEIIAKQCVNVQNILNKAANIGLKGVKPNYNQDRTNGIVNYVSNHEYKKIEKSFHDSLVTNSRSIVDASVKENADFHYKSGLNPKIVRKTQGKCCKWCSDLVGTYDYADVKSTGNDVFRRHSNCRCIVSYDPTGNSKKVQDVWAKTWYDQEAVNRRIAVVNRIKNDKIITGARITDPDSEAAAEWAKSYYEEIRHKSTDHIKVAKKVGITVEQAKAIKQYLFVDKNMYDEDLKMWVRFDEDPAIAQSWQRLAEGKEIFPHDETLIRHELYEMQIKKENQNISHDDAHKLAQNKYNYKKEALEYYDNLDKFKKNK